jgi:hypothetical protein
VRENGTAGDGEGGVPKNTRVGHSNLVRGGAGVAAERRDSKTNRSGSESGTKKKSKEKMWQVSASTPLVGNQRHKGGERLGMKKAKVWLQRVPAAVPQGGGKHFLSTWNTTIKVKGGHEN